MIAVNYKTKKALKESIGRQLRFTETSMYGNELKPGMFVPFVGPSATQRVFYGNVKVDDNFCIVAVK